MEAPRHAKRTARIAACARCRSGFDRGDVVGSGEGQDGAPGGEVDGRRPRVWSMEKETGPEK